MTLEEAARVARACVSDDSVETRYRWEALTVAFPEMDWRTMFKAEITRETYRDEVDLWDSPCEGERRLIAELREQIKRLTEQVSLLRKPIGSYTE